MASQPVARRSTETARAAASPRRAAASPPRAASRPRSVRSGSHLELIGDTWYYRRVVPPDAREAFGRRTIRVSLKTKSRVEAVRLEKDHDVAFEKKLRLTRTTDADGYSKDRAVRLEQLTDHFFNAQADEDPDAGYLAIPKKYWTEVDDQIQKLGDKQLDWEFEVTQLLLEIREILELSRSLRIRLDAR